MRGRPRTSVGHRGFTLPELLLVISVIAVLASITIPNVMAARRSADETAAVATLRNIISAQAQFAQSGKADADRDGTGEYGGFVELSGAAPGRMAAALKPPVLSGSFRRLNAGGEVSRSGYLFRLYLPDEDGQGVPEPQGGYAKDGSVGCDLAESAWCVYAWPNTAGQGEGRTFFANQAGALTFTEDRAYTGPGHGPAADAAFLAAGHITGMPAVAAAGQDGNVWKQVN